MARPHRPLGNTGVEVPIIGYDTAPPGTIKIMDAPLRCILCTMPKSYAMDK
jgi:hypothetical protein